MKNRKFTVKEVPGSKRTSAHAYTHAVIGTYRYDLKESNYISDREKILSHHLRNYAYFVELANNMVSFQNEAWMDDSVASAKETVAKFSASEYAEDCYNRGLEDIRKDRAKHEGKVVVVRWSQSFRNAQNAVKSKEFSMYVTKIVEAVEI